MRLDPDEMQETAHPRLTVIHSSIRTMFATKKKVKQKKVCISCDLQIDDNPQREKRTNIN